MKRLLVVMAGLGLVGAGRERLAADLRATALDTLRWLAWALPGY